MVSRSTSFGLAVVMILAVGAPASAQVWGGGSRSEPWGGDSRYGQGDYRRQAYDNGYRRGMDRGERDGRDGRPMNYRDEKDYRNADWGYNGRYGSRDYYRPAFRSGFEAGYSDGYNRYARYGSRGRALPRPPAYGNDRYPDARYPANGRYGDRYGYAGDIGYQNGYRDGLEKGQKDLRGRKSYDVLRHDWYRDGDRHYEKEYGPRDDYRNAYRSGFQRGYDESFRGGQIYY
jgi:hypothetical protein